MPGRTVGSLRLEVDPELGLMAIGSITETGDYYKPIIPCYRDGAWSILRGFRRPVTDAARYGDTLLVCGIINAVIEEDGDSIPVSCIAAFYDGGWHPFGSFGETDLVRRLKVLDGELYAIGSFLYADGQLCNGVAKRVAGHWAPVGNLQITTPNNPPNLMDAAKYQGDLYVCGVINLAPGGERGIARYDGQDWSAPGGGIFGGFANGAALTNYHDELYLGGTIYLPAGNPGHMIQRWNGSEWHAVGGHLLNANSDFTSAARCEALITNQGMLLAAGGFQNAAAIPAQTFALWDGVRWCGTGDAISNFSTSIAAYNDTLYLASGRWVNGDSTNTVVKWVSGSIEGSICSEPLPVPELHAPVQASLWPNPASSRLTVQWEGVESASFIVCDMVGRVVHSGILAPFTVRAMDIDSWANGLYNVRFHSLGQMPQTLRFLKE